MIEIPFLEEFKDSLANGTKTATTRTKRYGKDGDEFTAFGMKFKLLVVVKERLSIIKWLFYKTEGFNTENEFVNVWNKIHPKGYESQKLEMFWFHRFKRID